MSILNERYARQNVISGFGKSFQQTMSGASVLVVGCGGLGSPVLQYLAAAGVGYLTLFDDDLVEISNLNRQTLFKTSDIGLPKVELAAKFIKNLNPEIEVTSNDERLTPSNISSVLAEIDFVIDCTDGIQSKFLINDACVLAKKPFVHAAVTGLSGRVLPYTPGSACLRCLFSETSGHYDIPGCRTHGALGVACGIVGTVAASFAINLIKKLSDELANFYYLVDCTFGVNVSSVEVAREDDCPVCGLLPSILSVDSKNYV